MNKDSNTGFVVALVFVLLIIAGIALQWSEAGASAEPISFTCNMASEIAKQNEDGTQYVKRIYFCNDLKADLCQKNCIKLSITGSDSLEDNYIVNWWFLCNEYSTFLPKIVR